MKILQTLINRRIIIVLLCAFIVITGAYSFTKLDVELLPDISFRTAVIEIQAGELSSEDVEEYITTPIEQRISSINEIESYESVSTIGYSSIAVTFENDDFEDAFNEMESIVNGMYAELPGVTSREIYKMGMGSDYDYFLDVHGGDMNEMSAFVDNIVKPRLNALPEVGDIATFGLPTSVVDINIKEAELTEHQINVQQIIHSLQEENVNVSFGEVQDDGEHVNLRWNTEINELEELKRLPIQSSERIIELQDIADVEIVQNTSASLGSWKNGAPNISIQISSSGSATAVDLSQAVKKEVEAIKNEGHADGFVFEELVSTGDFIQNAIDEVKVNVLIGGILALVVLFILLRSFKAMVIIGFSIPASILLTLICMYLLDYTINLMTLIALGLGIGMMVDASIVILEAIYKKMNSGLSRMKSCVEGIKEVGNAVIATMLTTIVVFLPIGIMGGDGGELMIILVTIIVVSLVSSVFVSFTVIPVMAYSIVPVRKKEKNTNSKIYDVYEKIISWQSKRKWRRWVVTFVFLIMLIGSAVLGTKNLKVDLLPDMYYRQSEIFLSLEKGVTPEEQRNIAEAVHQGLKDMDDIKDYLVLSLSNEILYSFVNMIPEEEATLTQAEINQNIDDFLANLKDDHPIKSTSMMDMYGPGSPVQVRVTGENLNVLQSKAAKIEQELKDIEGLYDIGHSIQNTIIEKEIVVNEDKIIEDGLTPSQIRNQLQLVLSKQPIGQVKFDGDHLPIMVSMDKDIESIEDLENYSIFIPHGEGTLSNYVNFEEKQIPIEIDHYNGERSVVVHANYDGMDLGEINRKVQDKIKNMDQSDVRISVAGDLSEQTEMLLDLAFILLLALFLVYVVMAIQFNSFTSPLVIMFIIPMSIIGVFLGLYITDVEFSIMAGMGVVMFIGIVLNNAILLVDRTKQLRQQNLEIGEALINAGKDRIRPIFLTTLSTVAGMLPLALATGNSSSYQVPMATVVISGLLFATIVSLIFLPAIYLIVDDIFGWPKRIRERKKLKKANKKEAV